MPPRQPRILVAVAVALLAVAGMAARQASSVRPAAPFTVVAPDGRRTLATAVVNDQAMVSLDDLAALFQLTVRDDSITGGVIVACKGKTVILTPGQPLASAGGRLVSLPAPVVREGGHWLVPVEFVSRALGLVYDRPLEVRKGSRLVLVGAVRVPRVVVRQEPAGPQTRLTFQVSPRTPHTVTQEAGRILVRFDADALDATLPPVAPQPLLQGLRLVEPAGTIAVEVGPRFGTFRASVVPRESGAGEIILDLIAAAPEAQRPALPAGAAPAPQAPAEAPAAGTLRTIVIDPGHGGDETGAKGAGGTQEKDVTLALAHRLKAMLESRLGVRVLLTRDGDQKVALDDRAALANNNKADLFLSLHANASVRQDVSGAQIYYLAAGQVREDPLEAASRATLPALGGGSREIDMILWEMAQLRHLDESAMLAAAIEEQFRGHVRLNARPVMQAPFRVLAGANMPAVLVEAGFLTNPDEEQQLASEAYQNTVAQALFEGLVRYRDLAAHPAQQAPAAGSPAQPQVPAASAPARGAEAAAQPASPSSVRPHRTGGGQR